MNKLLFKYFALNHRLHIPGIGTFSAAEKPALLNFAEKEITVPPYEVSYKYETLSADKNFFSFLCSQLHTEEWKAIITFNDFVSHIKNVLTHEGSYTFPGIGIITRKPSGEYSFSQTVPEANLFPEVQAERVIRKNAEHAVMVGTEEKSSVQMQHEIEKHTVSIVEEESTEKQRWWIPAAILGCIGVLALLIYYLFIN